MDKEIKELLEKLLTKQEDILKRIEALESMAHRQHYMPGSLPVPNTLPGDIFYWNSPVRNPWYHDTQIC
jgi:hypothetical protein